MAWKQARERDRRLKKLCKSPDQPYVRGYYYDEEKRRPVRNDTTSRSVVLKRISNKKVRRANRDYARNVGHADRRAAGQHGDYRRLFDFWWEMF